MITKDYYPKEYYLKDLDVSQLPFPVREQIEKGNHRGVPYEMIGCLSNWVEPSLNPNTGEYHTYWMLMTTDDGRGSFTVMKSPWVSPRIDKYLENILINKEEE